MGMKMGRSLSKAHQVAGKLCGLGEVWLKVLLAGKAKAEISYKKKCLMNGKKRVKGRNERTESAEKGWKDTRGHPTAGRSWGPRLETKRKAMSQSGVSQRSEIKRVRKRRGSGQLSGELPPGWRQGPKPRGEGDGHPGTRWVARTGWAGGVTPAVKPKAGLLSGSVRVAMTRAARRGGIGHAGTRRRFGVLGGGHSGRGRWGLEGSPAAGGGMAMAGGDTQCPCPVPLAPGAALGAGSRRGCS